MSLLSQSVQQKKLKRSLTVNVRKLIIQLLIVLKSLPGNAIKEIVYNDRIIGAENKKTHKFVTDFYKMFVKGNIYLTTIEVAEFTKLAENSYRDTNIAFANELAVLCEKNEVNPKDVIFFANKHPRVNILSRYWSWWALYSN